jgi:hypothetical protein
MTFRATKRVERPERRPRSPSNPVLLFSHAASLSVFECKRRRLNQRIVGVKSPSHSVTPLLVKTPVNINYHAHSLESRFEMRSA